MPFEDDLQLKFHYLKHKNEFNFASENEYVAAADAFMSAAAEPPIREAVRPNGERVRFNRNTRELGIVAQSGWLKTYHKPSEKYIFIGYFLWECGKGNPKAI